MAEQKILLDIQELSIGFDSSDGVLPVLDKISLPVGVNETVALVGESGCGKSVTAMSIMRLLRTPPARYLGGSILFEGTDLLQADERTLRGVRGNRISMIFQEPLTSLNPVLTIGDQLGESLRLHSSLNKRQIRDRCVELLGQVQISSPEQRLKSYPSQFSGGMRQRIMIAMAIACQPQLLIADEPTTALDVTIQAQILKLLRKVQQENGISILLITHDLGVVAEFTQRIVVMYAGQVVESASTRELFHNPCHPYTKGLLQSLPKLGNMTQRLDTIPGAVPTARKMPKGCRFHPRCPSAMQECVEQEPELRPVGEKHHCKCHLYKEANGGENHE